MMLGVSACWLGVVSARWMMLGVKACWLGVVTIIAMMRGVMRVSSAVRVVDADSARMVRGTCFGWSSEDGCRSQGGDEDSEGGGEVHAGLLFVYGRGCGFGL